VTPGRPDDRLNREPKGPAVLPRVKPNDCFARLARYSGRNATRPGVQTHYGQQLKGV
jgi:hypothetical protein